MGGNWHHPRIEDGRPWLKLTFNATLSFVKGSGPQVKYRFTS